MLTLGLVFFIFLIFLRTKNSNYSIYYICYISFFIICHFVYFISKDGFLDINLNDSEWQAFWQTVILLLVTVVTYRFASVIIKIGPPQISVLKFNVGHRFLLLLYSIGVVIYTLQNGIALGLSYNERLTANTGGGLSIILMYAYIPAMILAYISMPNRKNLFLCLCLSTLCGIIYYIVIGGSRNVLAAGVFSLVYLALLYKNINKKQLFLALAIGVMTLMLLELYRYVNNFSDALDFILNGGVQVILFAFESFSPMHAVLNINDALTKNYFEIQYATTFLNEFSIIIPRFLWEGKPINVYNNGYFYTAEILGLDTNLTMSPTFLGSCLIMFGQTFYWIGGILCGLIIFIFDKIISSSKTRYIKLLLLSSIGYLFFWVRDGFEVYCYVLIKFGIIMMIMYAFNSFMSSLIIRR